VLEVKILFGKERNLIIKEGLKLQIKGEEFDSGKDRNQCEEIDQYVRNLRDNQKTKFLWRNFGFRSKDVFFGFRRGFLFSGFRFLKMFSVKEELH